MIDILFEYGLDIKSTYDKEVHPIDIHCKIDIETFIFLEKYAVDILPHINNIGEMYCFHNDIKGVIFCLRYGADINNLLKSIGPNTDFSTIKYLIELGADIHCLEFETVRNIINLDSIMYLVESGLDISSWINKLVLYAIKNHNLKMIKYFINMGADIHFQHELFLLYAARLGQLDTMELLLDCGASTDTITAFFRPFCYTRIKKMIRDFDYWDRRETWPLVLKFLIEYGVKIPNPTKIFGSICRYKIPIDEFILAYFLDIGLDLNTKCGYTIYRNEKKTHIKSLIDYAIYFNQVDQAILFLKYGANLTNQSIEFATELNNPEFLLLIT